MTGGVAVILGEIGANFGAGMTGGMAYIRDPDGEARSMMNMESIVTVPVSDGHYMDHLKELIEMHYAETHSATAAEILQHWDEEKEYFVQVCPKEMLDKLAVPLEGLDLALPAE